jgi:hypothetical protein
MESRSEQRVAIKFFSFKACKPATETVEMVRAACGNQALRNPTFSASVDGFEKGGNYFQTTPGVVAPLSLEKTTPSERFGNCC